MAEDQVKVEDLPDLVIVTGMSGAGRTEAMHVFEDLGYFCVDNLPSRLLGDLVNLNRETAVTPHEGYAVTQDGEDAAPYRKLAVVCDSRNGDFFGSLDQQLSELEEKGISCSMIFLDAADEKLVARYKSSRRRHPLCSDGSTISQGIERERLLLKNLRDRSDFVIDTTDLLPQALRTKIRSLFDTGEERKGLAVTVYSFGFKHGAPTDADLVIDVRFLPNPYYDPHLRGLTGLDPEVRDFVLFREETIEFEKRWHNLLDLVMPGYVAEGKQQLAIGVGCTGGQHRSVALAESTGDYLKAHGYRVSVAHRDLKLAERGPEASEAVNEAPADKSTSHEGR